MLRRRWYLGLRHATRTVQQLTEPYNPETREFAGILMPETVIILTTVPSEDLGVSLARELVRRGLVACVNVLPPMVSIYLWKGEIHQDSECQVLIKTIAARVDAVQIVVTELHPYDLPEFVVLPIVGGDPAYLAWVATGSGGEA
jgi:periplasmic divalent cation tolerance protein